ncbi:MAG: Snf7 family protein [Candidatus Marsarchaeota archaeon]
MTANWEEKESLFKKLEEHIRRGPPLKERINHAIYVINTQKEKLEQMSSKLQERDKEMFGKTVAAMAEGDTAHAAIYANECSELRKMAKVVLASQLALEQVALRLETVEQFGDLAVAMAPIRAVMADTKSRLAGVVPEVASELEGVNDTLGKALIEVGEAEGVEEGPITENDEARKILEEANTVAEQKVKEKFPQIPSDQLLEGEGVGATPDVTDSVGTFGPVGVESVKSESSTAREGGVSAQNAAPTAARVSSHTEVGNQSGVKQPVLNQSPKAPLVASSAESDAGKMNFQKVAEPTAQQPAFDKKLLDYIRSHGGELRISLASKDLGVPPAYIKETLDRLSREGKVKLA